MLLEARHVHVSYGDAPAVWDASLEIDAGQIVSVVGPNGAGKSTLINAIAGILRPRQGQILVDGVDITAMPGHRVCDHGVAIVPEGRRLFTHMSVQDNLELGAYRAGARSATRETMDADRRLDVGRTAADGRHRSRVDGAPPTAADG